MLQRIMLCLEQIRLITLELMNPELGARVRDHNEANLASLDRHTTKAAALVQELKPI